MMIRIVYPSKDPFNLAKSEVHVHVMHHINSPNAHMIFSGTLEEVIDFLNNLGETVKTLTWY